MPKVRQAGDGSTTAMRWTARILALLAVGLFLYFAVDLGSKVFPALRWRPQGIPLMVVLCVSLAGVMVAWRWELAGGIITVVGVAGIMALVCLGSGIDMLYCALLFTFPLLLAGALYLGCCWRTRMAKLARGS